MSGNASSAAEISGSFLLSALLASAAAVWHSAYWWPVAAACAVGAWYMASRPVHSAAGGDAQAFLQASLLLGRAEWTGDCSMLQRLVREAFRDDRSAGGGASIDLPGIWENTEVRCAICGAEYDSRLKYDLHLRPAAAAEMLKCPACDGRQIVLTYVRPGREEV